MSTVNAPSQTFGRKFPNYFDGIARRISQYRTYRQTLDELHGLNERELTDLGINRAQLRSIAYRAAYEG